MWLVPLSSIFGEPDVNSVCPFVCVDTFLLYLVIVVTLSVMKVYEHHNLVDDFHVHC